MNENDRAVVSQPLSLWARSLVASLTLLLGMSAGLAAVQRSFTPVAISGVVCTLVGIWWVARARRLSAELVERVLCWFAFLTGFFGMALFAVDVGPFTLFPFRVLLLLLWVLLLVRALASTKPVAVPLRHVRFHLLFLAVWVGYGVLTLAWSASTIDAVRQLVFLLMGASAIFLVLLHFSADKDQKMLHRTWMGTFVLLLLLGLWEHVTGQHLPSSPYHGATGSEFYAFWPTGTFGNPNNYATYLALSTPFALSLVRYSRNLLLRVAALGSAVLAAYLILAVGSRGNLVAVLMMVAFLTLFLVRGPQRRKLLVVAAVFAVSLSIIAPTPVQEILVRVGDRVASLVVDAPTEGGSVSIRWNLLRNGLHFVRSTGGMGVGAGNAEYWMSNCAIHSTFGVTNLHNWWLELLVNYGVLLFAGYLLFYLSLIRSLWRVWKRTVGSQRMVCEALLVSLVGFAVASMSPSSVMVFPPQWLLFAFALSFVNCNRRGIEDLVCTY